MASKEISLDAVGIDGKRVGALLIHERIDVDRNLVLVLDLVAVRAIGPHDARISVVGVNAEVETLTIVGNRYFRFFRCRSALDDAAWPLEELGHTRRRLPDRIIEPSVDRWCLRGRPDRDSRTTRNLLCRIRLLGRDPIG